MGCSVRVSHHNILSCEVLYKRVIITCIVLGYVDRASAVLIVIASARKALVNRKTLLLYPRIMIHVIDLGLDVIQIVLYQASSFAICSFISPFQRCTLHVYCQ